MRKAMIAFTVVALLAATASLPSFGAGDLLHQKLVVDGIAATVSVIDPGNGIEIQARFESSWYPVGCLSAYRDLRYELRTSGNRVIPMNEQTWQNPPYEGPDIVNHVISGPAPKPPSDCTENAVTAISYGWPHRAVFSALYPNLPPGEYALHISFAPHGIVEQGDFAPVRISIAPSPSPT